MDIQKGLIHKTLVIGIILLFVFMGINSSIAVNNIKKSPPPTFDGNILYVGGSGDRNYSKIQNAINDASDGDTVFVYDDSSPYKENVIVDKSIKLLGENRNTTLIKSYGKIIQVNANKVQISGFTIQQYSIFISNGIFVEASSSETIISNNIIQDLRYGIIIYSSNNTIYGNFIINNYKGIVLASQNITNSVNNTIYRNEIAYSKSYSIDLELSYSNKIYENNFKRKILRGAHIWWSYDLIHYIKYPHKRNQWYNNYWDNPRLLPKIIKGELIWTLTKFLYFLRPWYQFDWHPAQEPYDITIDE